MKGWEDAGIKAAVSVSALVVSALNDGPVSRSFDLTLEPILSSLKVSSTVLNQSKDWHNKGYKSPKTKPRLLSSTMKSPTHGQWSPEKPKDAPKRAKKNEIEGKRCLISE